jgi:hypothetical protein
LEGHAIPSGIQVQANQFEVIVSSRRGAKTEHIRLSKPKLFPHDVVTERNGSGTSVDVEYAELLPTIRGNADEEFLIGLTGLGAVSQRADGSIIARLRSTSRRGRTLSTRLILNESSASFIDQRKGEQPKLTTASERVHSDLLGEAEQGPAHLMRAIMRGSSQ